MTTLTYQDRFKTFKGVFDEFTNRTLFHLEKKGLFDELVGPLSIGKESNVFIAIKNGKKVIVKIYRMQNCDFKRMYDYIRKDPRYQFLKKHRRQIILSWAQREYKNILKAKKANVSSPQMLGWRNHILVEEFIGNGEPSPPLKDLYPKNPDKFFKDTLQEIKKLYKSGLIHGDLSSFNILNYNEKPVLIDFSQSTLVKSPNSEELLERDVKNVVKFFNKLGVKANSEEIFKKVVTEK